MFLVVLGGLANSLDFFLGGPFSEKVTEKFLEMFYILCFTFSKVSLCFWGLGNFFFLLSGGNIF